MKTVDTEALKDVYSNAQRAGKFVKRFTNEVVELAEDAIFYSKRSEIVQDKIKACVDVASSRCDSQLTLLTKNIMPKKKVEVEILVKDDTRDDVDEELESDDDCSVQVDNDDQEEGLGLAEVDYERNPTLLYTFIEKKDWNKVIDRLKVNPEEASTWVARYCKNEPSNITWRLLPLHAACYPITTLDADGGTIRCGIRGKIRVITELLRVFPTAARMKDDTGMIPLHLACRNGAPLNIIKLLIETYPKGIEVEDNKERTPYKLLEMSNTLNKARILTLLNEHSYDQRDGNEVREGCELR